MLLSCSITVSIVTESDSLVLDYLHSYRFLRDRSVSRYRDYNLKRKTRWPACNSLWEQQEFIDGTGLRRRGSLFESKRRRQGYFKERNRTITPYDPSSLTDTADYPKTLKLSFLVFRTEPLREISLRETSCLLVIFGLWERLGSVREVELFE